MKFYKRLLSIALSAAMAAQLSFAAFAQNITTAKQQASTVSAENSVNDLPPEKNDPSYWKNVKRLSSAKSKSVSATTASIYGSANLIHNSKFDRYDKYYYIDVSQWQTYPSAVNWQQVKASGITGVIVQLGFRGYGNGALRMDPKFYQNINGAISAGLDVGVYFFTQAINTYEAVEEANFCLTALKGYNLDLPVYIDMESTDYDYARFDHAGLTYNSRTEIGRAFCKTIENAGYKAGVYANRYWLTSMLNGNELAKNYSIWLAEYSTKSLYTGQYDMWQYTGSGYVNGVSTYVDINVKYELPYSRKQVKNLHTVSTTQNSIKLSWDKVSGASGYRVYMKNKKGKYVLKKTLTSNSFTMTKLRTGGVYFFKVKAYFNTDGTSGFVSGKSILGTASEMHTSGTVAAKGEGLKYSSSSENSITVSWSKAPYRCSGYQVVYYNINTKNYVVLADVKGTSYTRTGYKAGAKRRFAVRPYYIYGGKTYYGLFSDSIVATSKPKATTNVKVTNITGTTAKVSWKNLGSGIVYDVLVSENGKYVTKAKSVTGSSCTVKNLIPAAASTLKIRSVVLYKGNRYAYNYSPAVNFTTKPAPPATVAPGSSYSETTTSVSWSNVPNASKYQVYYCKDGENEYKYYADVSSSKTSVTLENLEQNQRYSVKIRTISDKKYSSFSKPVTVCTKPFVPNNFKCVSSENGNITLNWDSIENALGYRIYIFDNEKNDFVYYKSYLSSQAVISGLDQGTYRFKIAAVSSTGQKKYLSNRSDEITIEV